MKQLKMPIMVEKKLKRILEIGAPECLRIEINLMEITGKTQGIIFKIRPQALPIKSLYKFYWDFF